MEDLNADHALNIVVSRFTLSALAIPRQYAMNFYVCSSAEYVVEIIFRQVAMTDFISVFPLGWENRILPSSF